MTPKTKIALFALFIAEGCTAAYAAITGDGLACIGWLLTTSLSAVVAILHCMNNDLNRLVLLREEERDNALRDFAKAARKNERLDKLLLELSKKDSTLCRIITETRRALRTPNTQKHQIVRALNEALGKADFGKTQSKPTNQKPNKP